MEVLQQQSYHDNKMEEMEKINAEHLRTVIDLEEKLEDSKNDILKYCHEIEILQDCWKSEIEEMKKQYQPTIKGLEEQLEKSNKSILENHNEIETLKNDNNNIKKIINELQAIVQEQIVKLQQIERNKKNEMYGIEEESHSAVEVKQTKISDFKMYK